MGLIFVAQYMVGIDNTIISLSSCQEKKWWAIGLLYDQRVYGAIVFGTDILIAGISSCECVVHLHVFKASSPRDLGLVNIYISLVMSAF